MSLHTLLRNVALGTLAAATAGAVAMAPRLMFQRKNEGAAALPNVWFAHRGLHDAGSGLSPEYAPESNEYVALARRCAMRAGYGTPDIAAPIAPENSLAAFAAACEAGFGIELDLQLTKDNQVVVVHDGDLLRVAGVAKRVADLTYEQLRRIALFPAPSKPGDESVITTTAQAIEANGALDAVAYVASADTTHTTSANTQDGVGTADGAAAAASTMPSSAALSSAAASSAVNTGAQPQGYYQHVPLFSDVLRVVRGRVALIVEYKFDHTEWTSRDELLMKLGNQLLSAYEGYYCVESFQPFAMQWYKQNRPDVFRGQLAEYVTLNLDPDPSFAYAADDDIDEDNDARQDADRSTYSSAYNNIDSDTDGDDEALAGEYHYDEGSDIYRDAYSDNADAVHGINADADDDRQDAANDAAASDTFDWKLWAEGKFLFNWLSRPDFFAYDWHGYKSLTLRAACAAGAQTVSWTVRSKHELALAERAFDRHIFEAFVPDTPLPPSRD